MDLEKFRSECLKAHNAYRQVHGAEPLEELKELNDYAQNWAKHMASTSKFGHSYGQYGENIAYMMQSDTPTGDQVTKMWYDEEKDYDYVTHKSKTPGKAVGHFTQVVWKGTQHAGFGVASDGDRKFFAVGSYKDPGNITNAGYYEKNVGHKTGEPHFGDSHDSATGDKKPINEAPVDEAKQKIEKRDVESDDKDKQRARNELPRPVMKTFRKSFMEQVNQYREDNGTPSLTKDKPFQKLAQKSANEEIRGKHANDDVPEKLIRTISSLSTGDKAAEDIKKEADTDLNSKNMFNILMSKEVTAMGIGVSCPRDDGGDKSFIIVYLR